MNDLDDVKNLLPVYDAYLAEINDQILLLESGEQDIGESFCNILSACRSFSAYCLAAGRFSNNENIMFSGNKLSNQLYEEAEEARRKMERIHRERMRYRRKI